MRPFLVFGGLSTGDADSFRSFEESSGCYHAFVWNRCSRQLFSPYELDESTLKEPEGPTGNFSFENLFKDQESFTATIMPDQPSSI